MFKTFALAFLASTVLAASALAQNINLTAPKPGALVDNRHLVTGTVDFTPVDEKIWILVKPLGFSDIWVQPFGNVDGNGTFQVRPHFGRPLEIDKGVEFEFRAIADPHVKLEEGMRLSDWPEGRARTSIIRVTRR